ncbi:zinc finger MYM-type protein 1-like isoform X1 [Panicum virgatum]|uniref:TTF-type domain-containing protein n=1 Tax=Panicum virgatum TaxID=38727 RepID=A0A8T0Q9R3_PANVG|nr:zinc finger MYM-type protein 1-like isoform X1 [Panicum virgatum]XP_039832131.1 zinc finger MYM-type protein 1-like isoform X1 [Panicum virgatum]XP_039832132.1 zinc finger MYM-type protein 1-like isoform X1 [Panicum virgatum]KAG2567586.1 hypothetical protein PVAP13_7NG335448 [Panicum virgatum]
MKKRKTVDLKSLWEKASKTRKVELGSTSIPEPVAVTSVVGSVAQPQDPPSVVLETIVSQVHNESIPSVDHEIASRELEIASNDPNTATTELGEEQEQQQHRSGEFTEPSTWSPIRDGDDSGDESNDEAIYDIDRLSHDPGNRIPIKRYNVNERNSVIRAFIALGPCQPWDHDFPIRYIGGKPRRFVPDWFHQFRWLEYSVQKDTAFCFVCYLFKHKLNSSGGDAFVTTGFRNWHMKSRITKHCGSVNSFHNMAQEKYNLFITPKRSIVEKFATINENDKADYMSRLSYSIQCAKYLLRQGLASRGHDESENSLNKGNFKELLNMLAKNFEEVGRVVLKNAPKNCKMTSPEIQRQIANCCAKETTKLLMEDLGGNYFAILADESSDVYQNEQLALCLRYVDKKGRVVERFLGIVHVESTTSLTLKIAIEKLLMEHNLSWSMVRGQGYDGASNMKGHVNGLKKLIMDECPSAFYVHCFAHQLQLSLVAVAKENPDCIWFFDQVRFLLNLIGNSCKKAQMLREAQAQRILEALEFDDIQTGKGLNQEMGLGRPGDTRWGSHYKTVMHLLSLYPSIRKVLTKVGDDRSQGVECAHAQTMLTIFRSYEFVFMAHLMQTVLGFTADLNYALQKRDQDIVNAVELISLTKLQLHQLREDQGWEDFLKEVESFCVKNKIKIPDMDIFYKPVGRDRRFFVQIKNLHRYRVDMFLSIIDRQLLELNERFSEVNTELLVCMAAFSPIDSFAAFDKDKLVKLAGFYPNDFSLLELRHLPTSLTLYINDMLADERFNNVKTLAELSVKLVETNKYDRHQIVYKLLKLVIVLPVATASVERVFSVMNYVKNKLRNKLGDQYLNDCLVTFIEREFFLQVQDKNIINRFQAMKERRFKGRL